MNKKQAARRRELVVAIAKLLGGETCRPVSAPSWQVYHLLKNRKGLVREGVQVDGFSPNMKVVPTPRVVKRIMREAVAGARKAAK